VQGLDGLVRVDLSLSVDRCGEWLWSPFVDMGGVQINWRLSCFRPDGDCE
jgi:hypothetical protein